MRRNDPTNQKTRYNNKNKCLTRLTVTIVRRIPSNPQFVIAFLSLNSSEIISIPSAFSEPETWISRQGSLPPGILPTARNSSSSVRTTGSGRDPIVVKISSNPSSNSNAHQEQVLASRSQGARPLDQIEVASKQSSHTSSNLVAAASVARSGSSDKKSSPKVPAPVVRKKKPVESVSGSTTGSVATSVKFAKDLPRMDLVLGETYTVTISEGVNFPVIWFQRTQYG